MDAETVNGRDPGQLMPDGSDKTFVLGLAMAGAVSAGAYTAGVLDTLFRAMAAHDKLFDEGKVPHRVVLKVMSGSSAGSICSALGAVSLIDGIVPYTGVDGTTQLTGLPRLHNLWVDRIRLASSGEGGSLLNENDLKADAPVNSLLDSSHVDEEALGVLTGVVNAIPPDAPLGFVAADLEVMLTTTSLQGIPYEARFSNEAKSAHRMASHSSVSHFSLKGLGSAELSSPWLQSWGDTGVSIDLPAFGEPIPFDKMWKTDPVGLSPFENFARSAVTSGAFPIGLSARLLATPLQDIGMRAWPIDRDPSEHSLDVAVPEEPPEDGMLRYVAVDGGVANNEPFELARYVIRTVAAENPCDCTPDKIRSSWALAPNPREADRSTRAIIMIDPFPEGPELVSAKKGPRARGLLAVIKGLMPALINQARFKPNELLNAMDENVFSRFLIAPSRRVGPKEKPRGADAIASGFAGGFGGFFDRRFREHDYRLGQQNARNFLIKYFVLNEQHEKYHFAEWENSGSSRNLKRSPKAQEMVQILQFDEALDLPNFEDEFKNFDPPREDGEPKWPKLERADFIAGEGLVNKRVRAVGTHFIRELNAGKFASSAAGIAWDGLRIPVVGIQLIGGYRKVIAGKIRRRLQRELEAREQMDPFVPGQRRRRAKHD